MTVGFYDGHMAVEQYKGAWILRARLAGDLSIADNPAAQAAMRTWRALNRAVYLRAR